MALLLVLLCMPLVIVKGEGSHCMATTTSGAQHGLSLYLRVCCVNSNLGQGVKMRENNSNKHILCPSVRPRSCPLEACGLTNTKSTLANTQVVHMTTATRVLYTGKSLHCFIFANFANFKVLQKLINAKNNYTHVSCISTRGIGTVTN